MTEWTLEPWYSSTTTGPSSVTIYSNGVAQAVCEHTIAPVIDYAGRKLGEQISETALTKAARIVHLLNKATP